MKCFFLLNVKEQQKSGRLLFIYLFIYIFEDFLINISSSSRAESTDPINPILDTWVFECTTCTGKVKKLRTMEAKIMKHHVLPHELANFGGKLFLSSR